MGEGKKVDYQVLLIAENGDSLDLVTDLFSPERYPLEDMVQFKLHSSGSLDEAFRTLGKTDIDVVLLDVETPESDGLERVSLFLDEGCDVPLVVLTGSEDTDPGVRAVEKGAQDYLVKASLHPDTLRRSIRYAVERHRLLRELKRRALIDDLTGLYNRRGFFYLGEHTLSLAERNGTRLFIIFADLDGLKIINDTRGHEAGDLYIRQASDFLKHVFRGSDIIARIGGDEFAVIAQAVSKESIVSVRRRFETNLAAWNEDSSYEERLSISMGIVYAEDPSPGNLDDFLAEADHRMYRDKAAKK